MLRSDDYGDGQKTDGDENGCADNLASAPLPCHTGFHTQGTPRLENMKTRRHAQRMCEFAVTALRGDVVIGQCVVQALNQDEALIEGSDQLSEKLALGLFDDAVTYHAESLDASQT
jgi:hypothetical protein